MTEEDDTEVFQEFTELKRGMIVERDFRGRVVSATVPNPFVIDQLLELELIDHEQHWHAMQFVAMRKVFLRPVATLKTITAYTSSGEQPPGPKYPIADNDYLIVLRDMRHRWQQEIVTEACNDTADMVVFNQLISINPKHIRSAFDSMTRAINHLLDLKEAYAEAEKKALALSHNPCHTHWD